MKKLNKILLGLLLIAIGTFFALKALDIIHVNLLFDGWWTLFIIIPAFTGIFTSRDAFGNTLVFFIGVGLLLACRDVFSFSTFWKLCIPAAIILIGLRIVFSGLFKSLRRRQRNSNYSFQSRSKGGKNHVVIFSTASLDYSADKSFDGNSLTAVFGGIDCYLENAAIDKSVTVKASAVFGTIDVYLPQNVNAEVIVSSHFGKVVNERKNYHIDGAPTVQIKSSAVFGGVNII